MINDIGVGRALAVAAFVVAGISGCADVTGDRQQAQALVSPVKSNEQLCRELRTKIVQDIGVAARAQTGPCKFDSDCVAVESSVDCQYSCPVAVAATKTPAFHSARAAIGTGGCSSPFLRHCFAAGDCLEGTPTCTASGHCYMKYARAGQPAPGTPPPNSTTDIDQRDGG